MNLNCWKNLRDCLAALDVLQSDYKPLKHETAADAIKRTMQHYGMKPGLAAKKKTKKSRKKQQGP